jgi:hypothetical protein
MPRSLLLFRAAMPNIAIIPHPIAPDNVKLYEWGLHPGTIDLLATEDGKFLVAKAKVDIFGLGYEESDTETQAPVLSPDPQAAILK